VETEESGAGYVRESRSFRGGFSNPVTPKNDSFSNMLALFKNKKGKKPSIQLPTPAFIKE